MKIDFSQKILWINGATIPDEASPGGELTLGVVAGVALNQQPKAEVSPTISLKRGSLAIRVFGGGVVEIAPDEAAMIQDLLPASWSPVIVARAHALLNG